VGQKRKVLIIFHLCFALSYLCWLGLQPFVRQVTATKAASLLLDSVIHDARFDKLPDAERTQLLAGQKDIQQGTLLPLVTSYRFVGPGIAWAFLSIVLCFFLLFHIEGARHAVWLLPALVILYMFSLNREWNLKGERLFPEEAYLLEQYIECDTPLKKKPEQLTVAWERYLINAWTKEKPSDDLVTRAEQLDEGIFRFNVERAHWVIERRGEDATVAHLLFHPPFILVVAYFIWNIVFAWRVRRSEARLRGSARVTA